MTTITKTTMLEFKDFETLKRFLTLPPEVESFSIFGVKASIQDPKFVTAEEVGFIKVDNSIQLVIQWHKKEVV